MDLGMVVPLFRSLMRTQTETELPFSRPVGQLRVSFSTRLMQVKLGLIFPFLYPYLCFPLRALEPPFAEIYTSMGSTLSTFILRSYNGVAFFMVAYRIVHDSLPSLVLILLSGLFSKVFTALLVTIGSWMYFSLKMGIHAMSFLRLSLVGQHISD